MVTLEKKSVADSQIRNFDRLRASPKSLPDPEILTVKISKYFVKKSFHIAKCTPDHSHHARAGLPGPPDNNYRADFLLASIQLVFENVRNLYREIFTPGKDFGKSQNIELLQPESPSIITSNLCESGAGVSYFVWVTFLGPHSF